MRKLMVLLLVVGMAFSSFGSSIAIEKEKTAYDKTDNEDGDEKYTIEELIAKNPPIDYVEGYIGKKYPAEWKEYPTILNGYKVVQLTSSLAEESKFYFTTDSYFPEMNVTAFVSNRTGTWNIFYCDMATGEITQVTDFAKGKKDDGHGDICVLKSNEIVYYEKGLNLLRKVNLKTFKDTPLYTVPDGYKLGNSLTATADGSIIALTLLKGPKGNVEASKAVFVNTDGSGVQEIEREKQQLSHVNISNAWKRPGIIYARKEIKDAKLFFYTTLDGSVDKVIVSAHGKGSGVSHPFWTPDGKRACYLKKEKGPRETKSWFGFYDLDLGKNFEFLKDQDIDMSANDDGSLFVGTGNPGNPTLRFWKIVGNEMVETPVFRHNATFPGPECRDVHSTFIHGTNNVIFNSDGDGNGNVYVLMERI